MLLLVPPAKHGGIGPVVVSHVSISIGLAVRYANRISMIRGNHEVVFRMCLPALRQPPPTFISVLLIGPFMSYF